MVTQPEYADLLVKVRQGIKNPRGMCEKLSKKVVRLDPTLVLCKGIVVVIGPFGSVHQVQHWWCTNADGEIIDATADQFAAILEYREIKGEARKCMNCGTIFDADIAKNGIFCSDNCGKEMRGDYAE